MCGTLTRLNTHSTVFTTILFISCNLKKWTRATQQSNQTTVEYISESICLERSSTYRFSITDSFGDGMCCDEGNGQYSFSVGGKTIKEGGDFAFAESFSFKFLQCSENDVSKNIRFPFLPLFTLMVLCHYRYLSSFWIQDCDDSNSCTTDTCYANISTCVYYTMPCDKCGATVQVSILTGES